MFKLLVLLLSAFTLNSAAAAQSAPIWSGYEAMFSVSPTSGGLVSLGFLGDISLELAANAALPSVTADPTTGDIFLLQGSSSTPDLMRYETQTGTLHFVGNLRTAGGGAVTSGPIACHPLTGDLYMVDGLGFSLWVVDPTTAMATAIGATASGVPFTGLAFSPSTYALYGSYTTTNNQGYLVLVNQSTGAAGFLTTTFPLAGLSYDLSGKILGLGSGKGTGQEQLLFLFDPIDLGTTALMSFGVQTSLGGFTFLDPKFATLRSPNLSPIGGLPFTVTLTGAKAKADTWIVWSLAGTGSTIVPELGVTLGIANPFGHTRPLRTAINGSVSFTENLPLLPGLQVWLQAAQVGVVSSVLSFTIQ